MSIDKILQYQEYDMKYIKLENELKSSQEGKKIMAYKQAGQQSYENLTRMNEVAEYTMENIKKSMSALEETSKQIDEILSSELKDCDEKQLDYFAKQLEKLEQKLEELEAQIVRGNKELNDINNNQKKEFEQATKAAKGFKVASEAFNELKKKMAVDASALMKEMKAISQGIAPELMERYQKVRANKRVPVFVPLVAPKGCGGCGMEVASDVLNKLHENKIQECPNCGRLIYIKD